MPSRRSSGRNATESSAGFLHVSRAGLESFIAWIKPYKEVIAILLAFSGTFSGTVAYAVSYFATRSHVERVECWLGGRLQLLPWDTAIDQALIEAQTKFAGQLTLLPSTLDTRALSAQIQKDIDQLRDRRAVKFQEFAEKQNGLIEKCNPGVRLK